MDSQKKTVRYPAPRREPLPARSGAEVAPALSGALAEISVSTVLAIFEMERRSGLVRLRAGQRLGLIGVRGGQVVRAAVGGGVPLKGPDALYALLDWRDGSFEYRPGLVRGADEMGLSTSHLLLEAARRADEHGGGPSRQPPPARPY